MSAHTGTIVGFIGSWGSGLAQLVVVDDDDGLTRLNCEAAPTSRALWSAFGNEIRGRVIEFETDNFGVLSGFSPIEEVA